MLKFASIALVAASFAASASAYTLHWHNNCPYTIWPGVGAAPYGAIDSSVSFGVRIDPGGDATYEADYSKDGVRSWARTGCDDSGSNCRTGANVGGLYPTDAGLQSNEIYFESGPHKGYGDIAWNLSHVGVAVSQKLTVNNGGNVKTCADVNCPTDQAFNAPEDYQAITTSPNPSTFDIYYC